MTKFRTDALVEAYLAQGGQITQIETGPEEMTRSTKLHAKRARRRGPPRNWKAQAEYDERHGTDNGYDPRIEAYRREM